MTLKTLVVMLPFISEIERQIRAKKADTLAQNSNITKKTPPPFRSLIDDKSSEMIVCMSNLEDNISDSDYLILNTKINDLFINFLRKDVDYDAYSDCFEP